MGRFSFRQKIGTTLLLFVSVGLLFLTLAQCTSSGAAASAASVKKPRGSCGMCHREIAQEWLNSLHAKAFDDTHFIEEAKKAKNAESECYTCHAPQSVRVKGLGQTPGFRTDLREVGVDCQVCHTSLTGKVHAPFKSGGAPHGVEVDPQHATEALCASCHAAFGTVKEFISSSAKKRNQTCATCHMPKIKRPVVTGGKPTMVASHTWKGGSDAELLKKAIKMEATVSPEGAVTAKVTNEGAGHRFPTGIHHHQAVLVVSVTDADGKETATKRFLFADESQTGGKDTRLEPDESRTVTLETGEKAGTFTTKLLYKRMPDVTDADATLVASSTAKL